MREEVCLVQSYLGVCLFPGSQGTVLLFLYSGGQKTCSSAYYSGGKKRSLPRTSRWDQNIIVVLSQIAKRKCENDTFVFLSHFQERRPSTRCQQREKKREMKNRRGSLLFRCRSVFELLPSCRRYRNDQIKNKHVKRNCFYPIALNARKATHNATHIHTNAITMPVFVFFQNCMNDCSVCVCVAYVLSSFNVFIIMPWLSGTVCYSVVHVTMTMKSLLFCSIFFSRRAPRSPPPTCIFHDVVDYIPPVDFSHLVGCRRSVGWYRGRGWFHLHECALRH